MSCCNFVIENCPLIVLYAYTKTCYAAVSYCAMIIFAASEKTSMPDTLGHSVGPERWELLARLAGNEVRVFSTMINN